MSLATLSGCGATAVRGSDDPEIDQQAVSTKLDRVDLDKMLEENLTNLLGAAIYVRWQQEQRPVVAVLPIRNETSEHVDSQLGALTSKVETRLVNSGYVRVVSLADQPKLLEEIRRQQEASEIYAPGQVAEWGRQLGARYFVSGKLYSSAERSSDMRRVQYFLFMRVLEVETGEVVFQTESEVTKALI